MCSISNFDNFTSLNFITLSFYSSANTFIVLRCYDTSFWHSVRETQFSCRGKRRVGILPATVPCTCYCTIRGHFANIISNINFDVPGQDFCLQSFLIFQVFAKVPKIGIFGLSKRHEKIRRLAIFLYFRVVIWLPFLNAKGDCDTLSHLSSRVI